MKTTNPWLKSFKPIVAATLAIVTACVISVRSAQAGYIVTLTQFGSNVTAAGSGLIDLTGLSFQVSSGGNLAQINPAGPLIQTGPTGAQNADIYTGLTGPTSFGSAADTLASSGSGDFVGIAFAPIGFELFVPHGYVSGNLLLDSSTYTGQTFSTLGVTPGTYEWTWGMGANQNFTLDVVAPAVPDSGSTFGLSLVALGGLFGVSRFRSVHLA